jgi:protein-S-isoprenylcysteine O-methyltransferase Ste14
MAQMQDDVLSRIAVMLVVACWVAFGGVFLLSRRTRGGAERKRDRTSLVGMGFQGVGYGLVFFLAGHAPPFSGFVRPGSTTEAVLAIGTVLLAAASVTSALTAAWALGAQWSFAARVLENHHLVVRGPYRFVRHPIYTAMLGMLWATGLAFATPFFLASATIVCMAGTAIRIRSEERLLQETFGEEWIRYSSHVPAVLPGLRW